MKLLRVLLILVIIAAGFAVGRVTALPNNHSAKSESVTRSELASPQVRKQMIHGILEQREFRYSQRSWRDFLLPKIIKAVVKLIERILGHAPSLSAPISVLSVILAAVVIILIISVIAYVLSKIGAIKLGGRKFALKHEDNIDTSPGSPNLALEEAAKYASSGEFRMALRMVYMAVLLHLDEQDIIRFNKTGTNWEYLALVRKYPELHQAMRPATMTFDRKWYGHEPANESDYHDFMSFYKTVEAFEVRK